jgi:hypothetical protein
MLVVMAISVTVILVTLGMIEEAMSVSFFVESRSDLAVLSQRPMNAMQRSILQTKFIFSEDALGTSYRTKIESVLPAAYPVNPTSLLPMVTTTGTISTDTGGVRRTGNALLIARQLQPLSKALLVDGSFPPVTFYVDQYVFEYYYLSRNTTRKFGSGNYSLDLIRFRSVPYADYLQLLNGISTLGPNQKTALSTWLTTATTASPAGAGVSIAWNVGQPLASSFYNIDANLAFPGSSLIAAPTITAAQVKSLVPELFNARVSGKMLYSVGFRTAWGNEMTGESGRNPVPRYLEVINTLPVDCGFEAQVVGPARNQRVLTRLVLYSQYQASKYDSQEGFVITSFTQ